MCDVTFKHPFRCLVSGPSGSGKTHLVKNLLVCKPKLFSPPGCAQKIYYYYNTWQPLYDELIKLNLVTEFIKGTPSVEDFDNRASIHVDNGGSLFILDDSINESNPDLIEIFTTKSHHLNASIIFVTQNLFAKLPEFRTLSLNCQYIFLMKSPRDVGQIHALARQMFPGDPKFVIECYKVATRDPYSYLLLDAHQETPNHLRVRSRIFYYQFPIMIFMSKRNKFI